jgi:hypothetical protein
MLKNVFPTQQIIKTKMTIQINNGTPQLSAFKSAAIFAN